MKSTCNCIHPSQDKLHGPQVRIFNQTETKTGQAQTYRCTVCAGVKVIKSEKN